MAIDPDIASISKLVNSGDASFAAALEAQIKSIACRLFPELDWNNDPVIFKIGDSPLVNGGIYTHASPPVLVLDKGLLSFLENEDELAFVIGHELGHKDIREKLKYEAFDSATKGEEAAADVISILRCVKAGYSYRAGSDFFKRLDALIKKGGKDDILGQASRLFDPHPYEGNRIAGLELALANENLFRSGTVRDVELTPMSGPVSEREKFGGMVHKTFLDSFLPADYEILPVARKIGWLRDAVGAIFDHSQSTHPADLSLVADYMDKLKADLADAQALEEAVAFIQTIQARADAGRGRRLSFAGFGVDRTNFNHFYPLVARIFNADGIHGLPAIGPFAGYGQAVDAFFAAPTGARDEAARALTRELRGLSMYMQRPLFLEMGNGPSPVASLAATFKLRQMDRLYTEAKSSDDVAEAIWLAGGANERRFYLSLSDGMLSRLIDKRPVLDDYGGEADRSEYEAMRRDVKLRLERWAREKLLAEAPVFIDDPEKFLMAHAEEIFPKGNPAPLSLSGKWAQYFADDAPAKTWEKQGDISRQISGEILAALKNSEPGKQVLARKALESLFIKSYLSPSVEQWLWDNGQDGKYQAPHDYGWMGSRKRRMADSKNSFSKLISHNFNEAARHYDAYKLDKDHPFCRLILEAMPYLENGNDYLTILQRITDCREYDEKTLRKALGQPLPDTVRKVMEGRAPVTATVVDAHITRLSLERLLEHHPGLAVDGDDFLVLSRLHGQNGNDHRIILSPDVVEWTYRALWNNLSPADFGARLRGLSAAQLTDIYQFLEGHELFPDRDVQRMVRETLAEKIGALPDAEQRPLLERLLTNKAAAEEYAKKDANSKKYSSRRESYTVRDIALRNFAAASYSTLLKRQYGEDDGSAGYKEKIKPVIENITGHALPRDRVFILQAIAHDLNIQPGLSDEIAGALQPTKEDILKTHMPVAGLEALLSKMEKDDNLRRSIIDFLADPVSAKTLNGLSDLILRDEHLVRAMTSLDYAEVRNGRVVLEKMGHDRLTHTLTDLHENFSNLSIDLRAGILSVLLVPGAHRLDDALRKKSYNEAVERVFKKVFPPDDVSSAEAESFTRAFLDTAQDFEKPAILAALMALSSGGEAESKSLPAKAAEIMSLLGPAYVKLGQAINSHASTPEDWREATKRLKSNSGIEPRWVTVCRTRDLMPPAYRDKILHYGPVLGDASFNTGIEVKMDMPEGPADIVALIERPHAWSRAETGFNHMEAAVNAWAHPFATDQRKTLGEMVAEGREVARVETDPAAGDAQYARALQMYSGVRVEFRDKTVITINPVRSHESAPQIRLISKAHGVDFSALPETTAAEREIKRKVAKACLAHEFSNILSGRGFDCDRHGQQLKINATDPRNIKITVYDFGGMDIADPSPAARRKLGQTLDLIARGIRKGQDPVQILQQAIAGADDPDSRKYLMRTRKAWLALSDFYRYVPKDDVSDVLQAALDCPGDEIIRRELGSAKILSFLAFGRREFTIKKDPLASPTLSPPVISQSASVPAFTAA